MMKRVRLRRFVRQKNAGLVHVVPKTGDAFVDVTPELGTERIACFWIREVRERGSLRPDVAIQLAAVGIFDEHPEPLPIGISFIIRIDLNAGIDYENGLESIRLQIADKFC